LQAFGTPFFLLKNSELGLDKEHYRVLNDVHSSSKEVSQPTLTLKYNSPTYRFFTDVHEYLLTSYELAMHRVNGKIPVSEINYTKEQLAESQAFLDLENTTKQEELPDKANSVIDFRREGVTIYGAVIPQTKDENKDPGICSSIESFAGDEISSPDSKANKIFNFGGQFLEAIVLNEFSNSITMTNDERLRLKPAQVKGHVNWSKDPETKEIYATVSVKILTCNNPIGNILVMSTNSDSLKEVKDMSIELEKVMKQCHLETTGKTEENIVPICEMKAKLKLVENDLGSGYFLKADELNIKINTHDLISSKAPKLDDSFHYDGPRIT
ncbi:MAG: hypothetical protein QM652_01995, partial [Legionella sp.]|uniref:hypothetical protein n=1 Tax=Legionella sp. TaxID=459 RepID=UPI0039E6577E